MRGEPVIASGECKMEIAERASSDATFEQIATCRGPKSAEICPSPTFKPRILQAEDHDDTRGVIVRFLTTAGFDVLAAADLKGALEIIDHEFFDIIISDNALPDGTGYALISEARRRGILAIALSASSYPLEVFKPDSLDSIIIFENRSIRRCCV